ncbi:MAG TPA: hypothetical protein VHD37_02580 [Candidatus Paceibacterota bacterium]|nr:hypothetical protein [Candidatus Paceibacterota bacterium]
MKAILAFFMLAGLYRKGGSIGARRYIVRSTYASAAKGSKRGIRPPSQKKGYPWNREAKRLLKLFGSVQARRDMIRAQRKIVRQEPYEQVMRELAAKCGVSFKAFVTAVAIILVAGNEYVPTVEGALLMIRGKRHAQPVRDSLVQALERYEAMRQ